MFGQPIASSPRGSTLDSLTLDILTLQERTELERAVDGPITPAMIADKMRSREQSATGGATSLQYLRALLIWARSDLKFYEMQIVDLEGEISALISDRDHLYSLPERDRQTQHIAALNRQRDTLMEDCRPYRAIIRDAAQKLAEHHTAINE